MPASQAGCVGAHHTIHCCNVLMAASAAAAAAVIRSPLSPDPPLATVLYKTASNITSLSPIQFIVHGYVISIRYKNFHQFQMFYNWINQLSNTNIWWLDICCLLHRYQLHVSALMAIFRLID